MVALDCSVILWFPDFYTSNNHCHNNIVTLLYTVKGLKF